MTWPTDRPGYEVRELAIELALPLDVAERVLAYGKQERRAGYDTALTEVEQGVALPATICNRLDAAVQAERAIADRLACAAEAMPRATPAPGDSGTPHQFMIEAGVVWELDAALKRFRARGPTDALDAALAQARREGARDAREQIAKVFEDNDMLSTASEIRALPISASERIRDPIEHDLKCQPPFFEAVRCGDKPFEVRKDDRDYRVGDTLILREWRLDWKDYTGRMVRKRVTYKLAGGAFGVEAGTVVLGLSR